MRATLEVRYVQCTEIVTAQFVWRNFGFLLQTVVWSVLVVDLLTAVSLAGKCCTRRLELYTKAGASCFVVPCQLKVLTMR